MLAVAWVGAGTAYGQAVMRRAKLRHSTQLPGAPTEAQQKFCRGERMTEDEIGEVLRPGAYFLRVPNGLSMQEAWALLRAGSKDELVRRWAVLMRYWHFNALPGRKVVELEFWPWWGFQDK
jgi:hypothetical protein